MPFWEVLVDVLFLHVVFLFWKLEASFLSSNVVSSAFFDAGILAVVLMSVVIFLTSFFFSCVSIWKVVGPFFSVVHFFISISSVFSKRSAGSGIS
jgi:hypothetical protein